MEKREMSEQNSLRHISKECKLFKNCPLNWECLWEVAQHGSAIWSIELCYDLAALEELGFIKHEWSLVERRIHIGMISTFTPHFKQSSQGPDAHLNCRKRQEREA
jgi:hypothetical protein